MNSLFANVVKYSHYKTKKFKRQSYSEQSNMFLNTLKLKEVALEKWIEYRP